MRLIFKKVTYELINGNMELAFEAPLDFSFETPTGASYKALLLIQGMPIYSDSSMVYGNNRNFQNKAGEIVTHPKVETRNGTERFTRVKKRFSKSAKNTLGCTVPFTNTYHINSDASGLGSEFPEKAVDVHEIYHIITSNIFPELGEYPELEELTVRKVSDRLTGTKSAESYNKQIKSKLDFYDSSYRSYIMNKINKVTDNFAQKILIEPVKIFLPTDEKEEEALDRGQLPPYINTAA